jgi:hypothetical protein
LFNYLPKVDMIFGEVKKPFSGKTHRNSLTILISSTTPGELLQPH